MRGDNCATCGKELQVGASFCVDCGVPTGEAELLDEAFRLTKRALVRSHVTSLVIGFAILATVWSLLNIFVPETWLWGWAQLPINIGFFLLSLATVAGIVPQFPTLLSSGKAWAIGLIIWFLFVIVLRSIELGLLESIFKS